jgi:hypothetical protein
MCLNVIFSVHFRCQNCGLVGTKTVAIPTDAEDGPRDVDEFTESAALANVAFSCRRCESSIGTIVAVTMASAEQAA